MLIYARRSSYSLCATRKDWIPLQLLNFDRVQHCLMFEDGPYIAVKFEV